MKDPKKIRVKLSQKEYHELREQVWYDQQKKCAGCGWWKPFNEFSLHHWNRAIGDVRTNVTGYGLCCHPD
jgi:hypothetical protein